MILAQLSNTVIALIVVFSVLVLIAGGLLLYFFVISPLNYKKQVKNIEKQYSYCDALLVGQDTQYIHRLEIISRTNLLYLDKYEGFYRRFKSIFDSEDKFVDSILKQLNSLIAAKQYKGIKAVISEAKKAVDTLEESVKSLDHDLYQVIKLEEDCRKSIDHLREVYRHVKQTYYSESNDLEMVAATFNKMFDKIDSSFAKFDDLLEGAEYDEINAQVESLNNVLTVVGHVLIELPRLCKIISKTIPQKISELQLKYKETEKQGVPLFHLAFKKQVDEWQGQLKELNKRIINLQCGGVGTQCDALIKEIEKMSEQLDNEVSDRDYFNAKFETIYRNVNEVEKMFLRICAMLPEIKQIYLIGQSELDKIDELKYSIDNLSNSKRYLDGFVHSGTRQPFSLLKEKLDELEGNYNIVAEGVNNFKNYIDGLKNTAEEAYQLISVYYFRIKEAEKALGDINLPEVTEEYSTKIEQAYESLNEIYLAVQAKPIDVEDVTNKTQFLKNLTDPMFEDIDSQIRNMALAETALVSLNKDRKENDVDQSLSTLEVGFEKGDFASVFSQANAIYKNKHFDAENN